MCSPTCCPTCPRRSHDNDLEEHPFNPDGDSSFTAVWNCALRPLKNALWLSAATLLPNAQPTYYNSPTLNSIRSATDRLTPLTTRANPPIRRYLGLLDDLQVSTVEIPLDRKTKKVWDQLQKALPTFALFRLTVLPR